MSLLAGPQADDIALLLERRGGCWYVNISTSILSQIVLGLRQTVQKVEDTTTIRLEMDGGRYDGRHAWRYCKDQELTIVLSVELKKKRTFRKFSYRGIDLDQYVSSIDNLKAGC